MQEPKVEISGSKVGSNGSGDGNRGLTRVGRKRQSRRCGERRTCPSARTPGMRCSIRGRGLRPLRSPPWLYDQELADRIRQLIGNDPELTDETKMFGGLAFLIRGNMAIAASGQGGAMVRVDPAQSDALEATTTARRVQMRGRDMPEWLRVSSNDLRTDDQLAPWVEIGTGYARSLPPK